MHDEREPPRENNPYASPESTRSDVASPSSNVNVIPAFLWKYLLSLTPFLVGLALAALFWYMALRGTYVVLRSGMQLTPGAGGSVAKIFLFAGLAFTLMAWIACAFYDVRAWDDRRKLQRLLHKK